MVHFLISSKFSQFFPIKENHQNTFSNITNSRSSFPALFNHFTTGTILRKGVPHITYIQRICPEFVFLMTDRYIATKTVNYENVLVLTPFFRLLIRDIPMLKYCGPISDFISESPEARQIKLHYQQHHKVKSSGTEHALYPWCFFTLFLASSLPRVTTVII